MRFFVSARGSEVPIAGTLAFAAMVLPHPVTKLGFGALITICATRHPVAILCDGRVDSGGVHAVLESSS
jgi:hypothetical protein